MLTDIKPTAVECMRDFARRRSRRSLITDATQATLDDCAGRRAPASRQVVELLLEPRIRGITWTADGSALIVGTPLMLSILVRNLLKARVHSCFTSTAKGHVRLSPDFPAIGAGTNSGRLARTNSCECEG